MKTLLPGLIFLISFPVFSLNITDGQLKTFDDGERYIFFLTEGRNTTMHLRGPHKRYKDCLHGDFIINTDNYSIKEMTCHIAIRLTVSGSLATSPLDETDRGILSFDFGEFNNYRVHGPDTTKFPDCEEGEYTISKKSLDDKFYTLEEMNCLKH